MNYMLLAILITAGSLGLLVAMGRLTNDLLGNQADRWAKSLANDRDVAGPQRRCGR
ncbi:hypothetical protein ACWF0M_02860 [Kribbella sp. NPDC055110]